MIANLYSMNVTGAIVPVPGRTSTENTPQLVLVFGAKTRLDAPDTFTHLRHRWPGADIALCSTAGEILGTEVHDNNIVICAIELEKTNIRSTALSLAQYNNSFEAGIHLAHELNQPDLAYILVLSDGEKVNGSELINGFNHVFDGKTPITGGLAGDGNRFESTLVGLNHPPTPGQIVGVGFYGNSLHVGHGSLGGWDVFGIERTITKSNGNVLYEIDGTNALAIYKTYLGKYADELPGSALLFPLSITLPGNDQPVVRTILSIDNEQQCLTFAGDVPEGAKARFMKANFDKLIDAAAQAAEISFQQPLGKQPDLALLISCVGRKLILNHRVEEEVEAVAEVFDHNTPFIGFYSYGELSPFNERNRCQLHNQTMTITTFLEK
jgi:hypothetical protein